MRANYKFEYVKNIAYAFGIFLTVFIMYKHQLSTTKLVFKDNSLSYLLKFV